MAKSANLYARIEPDVKEQAETILNAHGIFEYIAVNLQSVQNAVGQLDRLENK